MKTVIITYVAFILLSVQSECSKKISPRKPENKVDSSSSQMSFKINFDTVKNFDPDTMKNPPDPGRIRVDTTSFFLQIDSLTKLIEANAKDAKAYSARGDIKNWIKDYEGACEDWNKADSLGLKEVKSILEKYCK